jgi:hypothetical protein
MHVEKNKLYCTVNFISLKASLSIFTELFLFSIRVIIDKNDLKLYENYDKFFGFKQILQIGLDCYF